MPAASRVAAANMAPPSARGPVIVPPGRRLSTIRYTRGGGCDNTMPAAGPAAGGRRSGASALGGIRGRVLQQLQHRAVQLVVGGHHVARFEDLAAAGEVGDVAAGLLDQRSEEHTSELQSLMPISYAVF